MISIEVLFWGHLAPPCTMGLSEAGFVPVGSHLTALLLPKQHSLFVGAINHLTWIYSLYTPCS